MCRHVWINVYIYTLMHAIYIYIFVYTYICTKPYLRAILVFMDVCMLIQTCSCMYMCICIYTHMHLYMCNILYMYIFYTSICVYIYRYIYIYIYIFVYIAGSTCMHMSICWLYIWYTCSIYSYRSYLAKQDFMPHQFKSHLVKLRVSCDVAELLE